jgi:hypothetical protein
LTGALEPLRLAVRLDPDFAEAHFWLAQVTAWAGRPAAEWRPAAARAVQLAERLRHPRDSVLAGPLLELANGGYPQACRAYRSVLARDSTNLGAWLGVAECEARDSVVVRDRRSPSGWSFRGSQHAAVEAYRQALDLAAYLTPSFSTRLTRTLKTEPARFRQGVALPPDTGTFWAFPALDHDTLAFVPYREAEMQSGRSVWGQDTRDAAVGRSRELLLDIVAHWVAAYPASAQAHEVLAQTLEDFGDISAAGPGQRSALGEIRAARRLARTPLEGARFGFGEVRLLVKVREFARARDMADSLLRAWPDPDSTLLGPLAALAALTGRAGRAAELLAHHAGAARSRWRDVVTRTLPLPLFEARERLRAYAALGAPRDTMLRWSARFDTLLASYVGQARRRPIRRQLLDDVMVLAYPVLGPSTEHRADAPNYLLGLQWLLARGDTAAVRARFAALAVLREKNPPGSVAISTTFQEAWLLLQLGDTAAAVSRLEGSLNALATFQRERLADVPDPAALVRAMALRAELAGGRDSAAARRWGEPVTILWRDADEGLQPLVTRTRALLRDAARH